MRLSTPFLVLLSLLLSCPAFAVDTDGDGLLDLIDVPGFNPSAAGVVSFQRLGIEDLDGANLLTEAHTLLLSDNRLATVPDHAFDRLVQLGLSNNQLTHLEKGDFTGLTNLPVLDLTGNQITSVESRAFDGLANLQTLDLGFNQITNIESGDFDGLDNLQWLNLGGNQITSIESGAFGDMDQLTTLNMGGNPIVELNLSLSTFSSIGYCDGFSGFCVDGGVLALVLDEAVLSAYAFNAIPYVAAMEAPARSRPAPCGHYNIDSTDNASRRFC
ncbi:MAG: leucine-rich repeat domain-containing protein [Pirellulaceae bacterium]